MTEWRDRIVGARMAVDDRFSSEVDDSSFSRQEWGLIMTAVEFDIHAPGDDEAAELYADTEHLPDVMPEVERVASMQSMADARGRDAGGGLLDSVKSIIGLSSGGGTDEPDPGRVREARRLVDGYATALQVYLEENGSWEDVRATYRESGGQSDGDGQ